MMRIICMWFFRLAFAVYLITIILFGMVIRLGAIAMMWQGVIMILTVFLYATIIMNDPELEIPFGHEDDQILRPRFGWAFYLTLLTGIGCVILGCVIWVLNFFVPQKIAIVFNRVVVEDDEFFHKVEPESEQKLFEECGDTKMSTQSGITRYRQTQRLRRGSIPYPQLDSQHFKNESDTQL